MSKSHASLKPKKIIIACNTVLEQIQTERNQIAKRLVKRKWWYIFNPNRWILGITSEDDKKNISYHRWRDECTAFSLRKLAEAVVYTDGRFMIEVTTDDFDVIGDYYI